MGSLPQFTIKNEPIENQRPLKIRVIGAGYSGIYLGTRIPQRLRNVDLQIYEKNEGLGGTWWEVSRCTVNQLSMFLKLPRTAIQGVHAMYLRTHINIPSIRIPTGLRSMHLRKKYANTYMGLLRNTGSPNMSRHRTRLRTADGMKRRRSGMAMTG
jgi:cation diffusion facilitator CzcD-associated flavoprotein CzcO